MADDDAVTAPVPPNPLGDNEIKLTLPGQSRPHSVGGVFGAESVFESESHGDPAPEEATGAAAATEGEGTQTAGSESTTGAEAVAPEGTEGATAPTEGPEGAEPSYASLPERARRLPDRSVLRVLGAIVGAVVLLGGIAWWSASPAEPPEQREAARPPMPTGQARPGDAAPPGAVEEAPLPVTVGSGCPNQTDPKLATSTDPNSAWQCPTDGVPFGQKLSLTLPKPYVLTGICFWPGFNGVAPDGRPAWFRHRLIDQAQLVFNDPDSTVIDLRPAGQRHEYCVPLNKIVASAGEITIQQTSPPPPEPKIEEPSAPPGAPDAPPSSDVTELFPPPADEKAAEDGPDAASVAIWGLKLVGRPIL